MPLPTSLSTSRRSPAAHRAGAAAALAALVALAAACQDPAAVPAPATASALGGPQPRAGAAPPAAAPFGAGRWTVAQLLPDARGSASPDALNNRGQVTAFDLSAFRVTIGDPGSLVRIPMYAGRAINDAGDVAGDASPGAGPALLQTADGRRIELATPAGGRGAPTAINGRRQVAGSIQVPAGSGARRAVVWEPDGRVTDLGPGTAADVNEGGAVVGATGGRAFVWTPDAGHRFLAAPEGGAAEARAINDAGLVVGAVTVPGAPPQPAAWPTPDRYVLLSTGGARGGGAVDVNNAGAVLGALLGALLGGAGPVGGPVVWPAVEGAPQRLPLPAGASDPTSVGLRAINDRGQVIGNASFPPDIRAVVWTFEPAEPTDSAANAAPAVAALRADPAGGSYRVSAKACGGRYTVCLRFQVTDADGAADAPFRTVVDWGDGSAWRPNTVPAATPLLAPHDYAEPGTYEVKVTATDRRGAATTEAISLVVTP